MELSGSFPLNYYNEDELRLRRLRDTLLVAQAGQKTVSKKATHYFASMFAPFGSVQTPDLNSPTASPRFTIANLTNFCTYVVSEKKETIRRIVNTYKEAAQLTVDNTLTLKEKISRIATYLGALILILNAKVCHGDLKPENILWDDDHFVISDFNGSILIEDVCGQMKKKFTLEGDDYREQLSQVVNAFCSKNSKQLDAACKDNPVQFQKLIRWEIVNKDRQILDETRLKELRSYLRTNFFPAHSKRYASEKYLKKMGDYFWRCDAVNYEKAAQAFDIRSAGLTIYVILTGARPPLNEDDPAYYETLERSLRGLGIDPLAASIIRRMAEPVVKKFSKNFDMPVSIDELEELERIFANRPIVLSEGNFSIGMPEACSKSQGDLKTLLGAVQDAIERLSVIEGAEDGSEQQNAMNNLIDALSFDDIVLLGSKLPPNEQIDASTRKRIIQQAFDSFPNSCEMVRNINGKEYTILLLLDRYNLHRCDVLLKQEVLGDGASAVAFKALSLRSLRHVVVKYFQELADPAEAEHAKHVLSQIGKHNGVQSVTEPFDVETPEGNKKVVIDAFYKKRDYGAAVHGEILRARLLIPQKDWGDCDKVKAALNDVNKELLQFLLSPGPANEKHLKLKTFREDYGNSLIAILGVQKGKQLLEDYNSLITESAPRPAVEPVKEEEKKSPRKFAVKDLLPFGLGSPKTVRSPKLSPRPQISRRNSIATRTESLSWIDTEFDDPSKPAANNGDIEVINVKALEALLKDVKSDYRAEVLVNARRITLKAIRDCQRLILVDYLKVTSDPNVSVHPAKQSRDWQKQADAMGETYLDIEGINVISQEAKLDAVVEVDNDNFRQITLARLLDIKAQVWKITG